MAEVIWNANGQGEFDFDYLLKITNEKFVAQIERDFKYLYNREHNRLKVVSVEAGEYSARVTVVTDYFAYLYTFHKQSGEFDFSILDIDSLLWILEVMQNEK